MEQYRLKVEYNVDIAGDNPFNISGTEIYTTYAPNEKLAIEQARHHYRAMFICYTSYTVRKLNIMNLSFNNDTDTPTIRCLDKSVNTLSR